MREMRYEMPTYGRWEQWAVRGWTEEDLHLVIQYIKGKIDRRERREESLRLYNLIEPSRFEDDLLDARMQTRQKRVNWQRDRVLRQSGRVAELEKPAETAAAAMERTKLAEQLKAWKEANL